MHMEHRLAARALCFWMGIAAASPVQAGTTAIKCWTNGEGVRECGNAVPTEYAQQGHTVYNDHGVQVGTHQRAKSGEELAEEQRLAAAQAEEKRKTEEVAKADRVLLETFGSEDDLILARDGKVSAIDGQIRLLESHIHKSEADLERRMVLIKSIEQRGQKPAGQILADIESTRAQIEAHHANIESKRREQDTIRRRFDQDLERFRKLAAQR
jgi:hypothetical protein